jgi:hypothetical protein
MTAPAREIRLHLTWPNPGWGFTALEHGEPVASADGRQAAFMTPAAALDAATKRLDFLDRIQGVNHA